MNCNFSKMKSIAAIAALVAGISGAARADDGSMSIWTGQSYAAFNGGRNFPYGKPVFDMAPSAFRQSNPNGISDREYQALSSEDPVWQIPNPDAARQLAASDTATAWRQSHPHGLTYREYQALDNGFWRLTPEDISRIAAENEAAVAKMGGKEGFRARIARVFHVTAADQAAPAN
jgi:hypothetical protein